MGVAQLVRNTEITFFNRIIRQPYQMIPNTFIDIHFYCNGVRFHAKDGAAIDFFKHFSKFEYLNLLNNSEY